MAITKRLTGSPVGGSTSRVTESPTAVATQRLTGVPDVDTTSRVAEAPTGSVRTQRTGFLIALEGDESGILLLEGDMQETGTDGIKLEGDAGSASIGSTVTRRVA